MFKINPYHIKKLAGATIVFILFAMILTGCGKETTNHSDAVVFEGKEYIPLEYPTNIFHFDYNGNSHDNFEEVDGIYLIDSPNWDMIWNGGDLYCDQNRAAEAAAYYANTDHYVWYLQISSEDDEDFGTFNIEVTTAELEEVCGLEEKERSESAFWEEFDTLADLVMISEDNVVRGTLSIAEINDTWYWRSEIIDESKERDGTWAEYIQPLPKSLNKKLNNEYNN